MNTENSLPLVMEKNSQAESKKKRGTNKGTNSPLMTRVEAGEYLGVSRWTLRRMEDETHKKLGGKKLQAVWIRGCKFYRKVDIYALANLS